MGRSTNRLTGALAVLTVAMLVIGYSMKGSSDGTSAANVGTGTAIKQPLVIKQLNDHLWSFEAVGFVRYDNGLVSISTDNNLIVDTDVGKVFDAAAVEVNDAQYPKLEQLLQDRDWIVRANVEAILIGFRDKVKTVVTMKITPLGLPERIPVPEG